MLQRVVDTTNGVLEHTTPAQLSNPTLCTEWTVKDLINHMVGGATMFAISAEQGSVPDDMLGQLMGGDNVGDDPQGAWDTASKRAMAAFEQPGAMDKIVKLPFGEMPAGDRAQHRDLRRRDARGRPRPRDRSARDRHRAARRRARDGSPDDRPGAAGARRVRRRAGRQRRRADRGPAARVRRPQDLARQPPDSACMIVISSRSATGVARSRTDSSLTNTFMCLRIRPCSSTMRNRMPGIAGGRGRRARRRPCRRRPRRPLCCSVYERSGVGNPDLHIRSAGSANSTE